MLIHTYEPIGMWFGEDQRASIINTHAEKRVDYVFKYE